MEEKRRVRPAAEKNRPKERRPSSPFLCDEWRRIRIHGNSSTIFFASPQNGVIERNESWRIRAYARKVDIAAMKSVTEFLVKSLATHSEAPNCTKNYNVLAIVFSTPRVVHAFNNVAGMHQDTIVGVRKSSIQEGEEIPKIDNSGKMFVSRDEALDGLRRITEECLRNASCLIKKRNQNSSSDNMVPLTQLAWLSAVQ
ncbi:hypothetical protein Syun_012599 [Stephania yunnanensis]|uniref:Uncharacterized protein n=1 Tax=Stephania yunnanensis TaxID=152371 RepID=A0AAP0PHP0_9MAGN